jgi:hypothetical protein
MNVHGATVKREKKELLNITVDCTYIDNCAAEG